MAPNRNNPIQPYGRACMECSKSKCRCVNRAQGQGCERCHRMGKACVPGASIRAVNAQKNNPFNRIAQLEGKLDGLVSLLGAERALSSQPAATALPPPSSSSSPHSALTSGLESELTAGSPITAFEPSDEDAELYLNHFRDDMLQYFPFLHISSSAKHLRQQRPFLFLCIVAASAPSTHMKLALGEKIKQILAQKIILDSSKDAITIDLLLGLLTFLAWGHDYLLNSSPASLSRFTQLAMTLVFDLRLNKSPPDESNMLPGGGQSEECSTDSRRPARSLEEIRALLGCYVMSSIVSSYLAQIDPLQWTPYMEECLDFLTVNGETVGDRVFAHQVRLQLIASDAEYARTTNTPPAFYFKTLQLKVETAKSQIPSNLQNNRILLASIHYTELTIFGLALSEKHAPGFQRLEYQFACLNTVKAALDSFFLTPISEYSAVSFPFFTHLARYIVILYKLSTMNDPSLDRNLVLSTVDVLQVLDRLIENIQHAKSMDGERSVGGLLDRSTQIFTSVRSWCAARLAEGAGLDLNTTSEQSFTDAAVSLDFFPLEDAWLKNSFNLGLLDGNYF